VQPIVTLIVYKYIVKESVREQVLFRRMNLMRREYPFNGRFDIIFCRNVMIYFDQPKRAALVRRFHRHLEDDGYLFIRHSETLGRDDAHFRYVRPAVYQKMAAPGGLLAEARR
jgi:chemotaxis protein methyltransferase CheR